ncbi:43148_t:CDS:2, partial [Gigaspora margarita]
IVEYSLIEDMLYPNNPKRLKRLNELLNNINTFIVVFGKKKEKIDLLIVKLRIKINELTDKLNISKIENVTIKIYEESSFIILRVLESIFVTTIFIKMFGFVSSISIGIVIGSILETVISSTTGHIKRCKIQNLIKEYKDPRIELNH